MSFDFFMVLSFGFWLGIKHAIEPDHVIAVSTIASETKKLYRATLSGVFWGIGHTITLFIVSSILIGMKSEIPEGLETSLEFIVGIMLVYLGIRSLLPYKTKKIFSHQHSHETFHHSHFHCHEGQDCSEHSHYRSSYFQSAFIGLIHGLAGSAAMTLLAMSKIDTYIEAVIYILIFGVGTVIGMLLFTTMIGLPFALSSNNKSLNQTLTKITGIISTGYGLYYMVSVL